MEEATDYSWQGMKAAHAVLLCEMERGFLDWENCDRIDLIHRAPAQKHIGTGKQSWSKTKNNKKTLFCKHIPFPQRSRE